MFGLSYADAVGVHPTVMLRKSRIDLAIYGFERDHGSRKRRRCSSRMSGFRRQNEGEKQVGEGLRKGLTKKRRKGSFLRRSKLLP